MRFFVALDRGLFFVCSAGANQPGFFIANQVLGIGDGNRPSPGEHRIWRTTMFELIVSALTLVGYLVPQVIWAIRRGQ
jgi:hypothetical protein